MPMIKSVFTFISIDIYLILMNIIKYSNKYTFYKNTKDKFITLSLKIKSLENFMTYANF